MRCPYCEGEVSPSAAKCRHCGEWLRNPDQTPPPPPGAGHGPAPAPHYATGTNKPQESIAFALVTLLLLIFLWPLGAFLNIIGLFTGPKRGCFVSMFLVGVLLPVALVVGVGLFIYYVGWPELEEFLREMDMELNRS